MSDVRVVTGEELGPAALAASRRLMDQAFDDFTDDNWTHALGGWHAVIGPDDGIVAHAAVVPRAILAGGREYRCGYVEAVAVRPDVHGQGFGTRVMAAINDVVRAGFELGVLSTGEWHFYERLGWVRWRGPAFVRAGDGRLVRTEDEDDAVMVLRTPASARLDLTAPIACDERPGDSW